jgi:hypothetical protein
MEKWTFAARAGGEEEWKLALGPGPYLAAKASSSRKAGRDLQLCNNQNLLNK